MDLYVDVNTTACSLASTPLYLTTLGGATTHWGVIGATAIYFPTATGFRVYVRHGGAITPATANSWGWHINWSAVGNNKTVVRKSYDAGNQRIAPRENGSLAGGR